MRKLRAIIFVPADDQREHWEKVCFGYCEDQGYQVVAIVVGGAEKWGDLMAMTRADDADVIVVAQKEHLPRDRVPRTEVVAS